MTPETFDKWTAALRSGKYKQGKNALQANGRFCCLGVLCEVVGVPSRPRLNDTGAIMYDFGVVSYSMDGEVVSDEYSDYAEPPSNWQGISDNIASHLMSMNDAHENIDEVYTFEEIADYLDQIKSELIT
jgi:hypothetical protein